MSQRVERRFGAGSSVLAATGVLLFALAPQASARITNIVITSVQSPAFGGASFGAVGQYEQLDGTAFGEVDPRDPLNAIIQDIELAPRNARGKVEYSMSISILKPIDMSRSNHTILYDVVNRGNKILPGLVTPGITLATPAGDGFLEKLGFTLVWSGWQGDLLPGNNRLVMTVPLAKNRDGSSIIGQVRSEYTMNAPAKTKNLGGGFYTDNTTASYATVSLDNRNPLATLSRRVHQDDPRELIPNDQWAFANCDQTPFPGVPSTTQICLSGGFDTNHIYELIYTAKDPKVLGLGYAATRDFVSFLRGGDRDRHERRDRDDRDADDAGIPNPLAGEIEFALMHGTSQSGRMVRNFLDQGFNRDERRRIVFDGMNPHIASARIPLNVRFGAPGRVSGTQHQEAQFPGAEAPLTWSRTFDPISGERRGLLDECSETESCPKIIQTMSDTEYWHSSMSLNTTDSFGRRDFAIPANVRIFHFASTQHGGSLPGLPPAIVPACKFPTDNNSYTYNLRALLMALHDWVAENKQPPRSLYARIDDGTLKPPAQIGFPAVPGVNFTGLHNPRFLFDRGRRFDADDESGIINEPPVPLASYVVLEPRVDADGNDVDGVRSVQLQAPLGTYLGWSIRAAGFSEGDLCDLTGAFIAFATTRAERLANNDPRPSLEERYGNHDGYVAAVAAAANRLVAARLMLPDDAATAIATAQASNVLR